MSDTKRGTRISALNQIVAEQSIAWESFVQYQVTYIHVINTLSGKYAFTVQVLVHIRDRPCIDIESGAPA